MSYRFDQSTGDLIIDGWEAGIADSPYGMNIESPMGALQKTGLSDMRNVNIISVPGEVSVGFSTTSTQQTPAANVAYTASASADTFTYAGTVMKNGTAIVITVTTGTAGITSGHTYWVQNATPTTFKVGSSVDTNGAVSTAINITSDGTGTFTTVDMGAFTQIISTDTNTFYAPGVPDYSMPLSQFIYAVDFNGRAWLFVSATPNWVYLGNSTINSTPPRPNGIAYWNGYLLIFRAGDTAIDYIVGGGSSASDWHYGWKNGTSVFPARTFTDSNHVLYWCNGTSIGSLIQLTAFDPTNAATYSYTATALLLNPTDVANCIGQLGTNLLIGGALNILYAWNGDPLNAGAFSGYTPILLPEMTIAKIVTVNSNAYVFAGNRGRIYITNGANIELYQKIPDHLSGTVEPYFTWGGAIYSRNQLYFSCNAINPVTLAAIPNYGAIWAISTDTNALRLVNRLSYGTYAGLATELAQNFHAQSAPNNSYGTLYGQVSLVAGWYDGVTGYGADYVSLSPTPYSNYEAYVDSDMIPAGTFLKPQTDSNVEFKLTVPIVAGEGVKLAYRQNFSDSFTDIKEFTTVGIISGVTQVNFQKSQWIQIRCYLKSTPSSPTYTRLRELRIR